MNKIFPVVVSILIIASIESCSKKHTPSRTEANTKVSTEVKVKEAPVEPTVPAVTKNDSMVAVKPVVKKATPTATPKVIAVNDKFAKKVWMEGITTTWRDTATGAVIKMGNITSTISQCKLILIFKSPVDNFLPLPLIFNSTH